MVSHTWKSSFYDLASALHENFYRKWELHTGYRARMRLGRLMGGEDEAPAGPKDSEKRRIEGYLVWIDLVCLDQVAKPPNLNPAGSVSRPVCDSHGAGEAWGRGAGGGGGC